VRAIPEASGGTALYDAIVTGLYRFRTLQGRKALIILTDGEDTTSRTTYEEMLTYARSARVPLYFIGVGLGLFDAGGTSKMKALAAETGASPTSSTTSSRSGDLRPAREGSSLAVPDRLQHPVDDERPHLPKGRGEGERPGTTVRTIRGFIP